MKELIYRPRRLRRTAALREMVRETRLDPADLIYPLFVCPGEGLRREIKSMPGVFNLSVDELVKECEDARRVGVSSIIVFGLPERKDEQGSDAFAEDGITQRAIRAVKREVKDLLVIADTCLCEYTDHGHCGVIEDGDVANDPSLARLAAAAVSHARAGAHVVAPSDMMDGRVGAIRDALDAAGFADVAILAYAAKFASAYYGPFREAAESAPAFGDRRSYQMDPPNRREALREMRLDLEEGADVLMVKPALPYLDILADARRDFDCPLAAYHVSGEYAMIHAAAQRGWLDGPRAMEEAVVAIKRAGADWILTYAAKDLARGLRG